MAVKKRTANVTTEQANALANELADKAYGQPKNKDKQNEQVVRTSLALPLSMQEELEDLARKNKRNGKELKTVSAIAREAIYQYLNNRKEDLSLESVLANSPKECLVIMDEDRDH